MKLLMITTSHSGFCPLGHPTGLWLEELAVPYYAFREHGWEIALASPQGGLVPLDPLGLKETEETPPEMPRFLADAAGHDLVSSSLVIDQVGDAGFDALYLPGGYGAMFDLPDFLPLGRLIAQFLASPRKVAAVGHGVAGLISARNAASPCPLAGRALTCFSNAEEGALGLCDYVPFLLETRLRKLGAVLSHGREFAAHMVADRNLITGQNPASTRQVVAQMLG